MTKANIERAVAKLVSFGFALYAVLIFAQVAQSYSFS